jgi:hypothetical protein
VAGGASFKATVTMKNTGTTTWTAAAGYRLAALIAGNPWGDGVSLSNTESISPGSQKAFSVNVTAPLAAGAYGFQWQMIQNGVAFFGPATPTVNVTVTPVGLSAYSVPPCRVVDTRGPVGPYGGPALSTNVRRLFQMRGVCGVPSTAKGVMINVTAIEPSADGFLQIYPPDLPLPATSTLNYRAGRVRANNVKTTLDSTGQIAVFANQPGGAVQFVMDITGYLQ